MTKDLLFVLLCAVLAAGIGGIVLRARTTGKAQGDIRAKSLLTEREQPMFFRLQQAFPEHLVLCQVAFSALLTAKDLPTRATFNRKVADFVLATKAFEVVAIVELDDSSHRGRAAADSKRDALLVQAGYRVQRFKHVPNVDDLRRTLMPAASVPRTPQSVGATERSPG